MSSDARPPVKPGPGLRAGLGSLIASTITSPRLRNLRRRRFEARRKRTGTAHEVHYFHQVDDPYSALTAQILDAFVRRYDIRLIPHLVPPPRDWAAPDRERLVAYSLDDARAVAPAYGLHFQPTATPDMPAARRAQSILCSASHDQFAEAAVEISEALWSGRSLDRTATRFGEAGRATLDNALTKGETLRDQGGHYLGATFHYGGEWYWGVDRLDHLEARLADLGADRTPGLPSLAARPELRLAPPERPAAPTQPLELFLSLRSPYSWLVVERAQALADHYGLPLVLKPLLPMVMRGLPVPRAKRLYIVRDCKREAERLGLPFGKICDPVGTPVERGLAILCRARASGRDVDFAISFLKGVFAEGIDAGSEAGLSYLCARAGISWPEAQAWLRDEDWRDEVEANRLEMLNLSLWGVPSLRFGETTAWGQDRLWLIERAILQTLNVQAGSPE